jgi:predicted kinase
MSTHRSKGSKIDYGFVDHNGHFRDQSSKTAQYARANGLLQPEYSDKNFVLSEYLKKKRIAAARSRVKTDAYPAWGTPEREALLKKAGMHEDEDFERLHPRAAVGSQDVPGGRWIKTTTGALLDSSDIVAAAERMMSVVPTIHREGYGSEEWRKNREFSIDGRTVRGYGSAVETFVSKAAGYAGKRVAVDRQVFLLLGYPGAGKSTYADQLCRQYSAALSDSDEVAVALPEFINGEGAASVHEEACDVAALVLGALIEKGSNVVIPRVGSRLQPINDLISVFKHRRYAVHVVLVDVPHDLAVQRMIKRFRINGRLIPPEYMKKIQGKPETVYRYLSRDGKVESHAKINRYERIEGRGKASSALEPLGRGRNFRRQGTEASWQRKTEARAKEVKEDTFAGGDSADTTAPTITKRVDPGKKRRKLRRFSEETLFEREALLKKAGMHEDSFPANDTGSTVFGSPSIGSASTVGDFDDKPPFTDDRKKKKRWRKKSQGDHFRGSSKQRAVRRRCRSGVRQGWVDGPHVRRRLQRHGVGHVGVG